MTLQYRGRALCAVLALVITLGAVASPGSVQAQEAPELPPPPITIQDVVNELLPLIRQLDPLMAQLGPVISSMSKPLMEQGSANAEQLRELAILLEPLVALGGPAVDAIASLLAPAADGVAEELTPELATLLEALGPYLNQVDLATAFQVIGPLAPTAVQAIPTLNKYYDAIDVVAPLRDPLTCPVARAVPSQQILDIVTPFLCYSTIVEGDLPTGREEAGGFDFGSSPSPDSGGVASSPVDPPAESVAMPSSPASSGSAPPPLDSSATGFESQVPNPAPLPAVVAGADSRVELLEARLRLMFLLFSGLGLLLWSFFRDPNNDAEAGLGAFRRPRTGLPPSLL